MKEIALVFVLMMLCFAAYSEASVTLEDLTAAMPSLKKAKAAYYLPYLNAAMTEGSIDGCCRTSAFLAQLAHESGDLQWW